MNFEFNRTKVGYGLQKSLNSSNNYCLIHISPICITRRRKCLQLRRVIVKADLSSSTSPRRSTNSRRVYKESQAQTPAIPVDRIVSFVVPAGAFVVISFGIDILPIFISFCTGSFNLICRMELFKEDFAFEYFRLSYF